MKRTPSHRPAIRWLLRGVIVFQLLLPVSMYLGYAYLSPDSGLARWWFFRSYEKAEDRSALIRSYHAYLTRVRGGVPEEIRDSLSKRVPECQATPEGDAIMDLFLIEGAATGAWAFRAAPQEIRGAMIGNILRRQEIDSEALLFVEWLRRGEVLGKGGFSYRAADDKEEAWKDSHERRVDAYRHWWGDGGRWPENEKEDPLVGTPYMVRSHSS